jgi:hypothetical protein
MENETRKHQQEVSKYLNIFACELMKRAILHDKSKTEEPEKAIFEKYTPQLKKLTYGSKEYNNCLKKMQVALDHHYLKNRHHPEYYEINRIGPCPTDRLSSMSLIDIVEMLCDWLAAVKRHEDGHINKSIDVNEKRFNIDPQLSNIFRNTALSLQEKEKHFNHYE